MKDGKVKLQMFNYPIRDNKCWESMENELSSSGIFLRTYLLHCRFFQRSRKICEDGILNHKCLEVVSSSCPCSTTSIGQ